MCTPPGTYGGHIPPPHSNIHWASPICQAGFTLLGMEQSVWHNRWVSALGELLGEKDKQTNIPKKLPDNHRVWWVPRSKPDTGKGSAKVKHSEAAIIPSTGRILRLACLCIWKHCHQNENRLMWPSPYSCPSSSCTLPSRHPAFLCSWYTMVFLHPTQKPAKPAPTPDLCPSSPQAWDALCSGFTKLATRGTQVSWNFSFRERPSLSTLVVMSACLHFIVFLCVPFTEYNSMSSWSLIYPHIWQKCLAHKMLKKCCRMKNEKMIMWRTAMPVLIGKHGGNKALEYKFLERVQSLNLLKSFLWSKLYAEHLNFLYPPTPH